MDHLTYQQILAEQFEENAKNTLVYQHHYEEDDVDEHEEHEYDKYEVDDEEGFKKFSGNRNTEDLIPKQKQFEDKTKSSIRYDKDVKTHVVNVDSRFRAYPKAGYPLSKQVFPITYFQGPTGPNPPNVSGIINIGPFPPAQQPSDPGNFTFLLPYQIKNAITIQLTSISIPNVFYTFSAARENRSFKIINDATNPDTVYDVVITEGNYKTPTDLKNEINARLINIFYITDFVFSLGNVTATAASTYGVQIGSIVTISGGTASAGNLGTFIVTNVTPTTIVYANASGVTETKTANATYTEYQVDYNSITNKFTIYSVRSNTFQLDFTPPTIREPYNNGLGYNLGFERLQYPDPYLGLTINDSSYTAESFPDLYGDSYIYLAINDYAVIEHQDFRQTFFPAFAKIMLPFDSKNQVVQDIDLLRVVQREYNFLQPINLQKLTVKLLDAYGNTIDLKGANWSFTLEIQEILNPSLYEKLRDL